MNEHVPCAICRRSPRITAEVCHRFCRTKPGVRRAHALVVASVFSVACALSAAACGGDVDSHGDAGASDGAAANDSQTGVDAAIDGGTHDANTGEAGDAADAADAADAGKVDSGRIADAQSDARDARADARTGP
jgi:hypothetical protein